MSTWPGLSGRRKDKSNPRRGPDPRLPAFALLALALIFSLLGLRFRSPSLMLLGTLAAVIGAGSLTWFGRGRRRLPPRPKGVRGAIEAGLRGRRGQSARVEYADGLPAWPVKVVHPSRFEGVRYDLRFAMFLMPEGALIACLLRLYDIPETPYFLHRVFDPGFKPVRTYLEAVAVEGAWSLVLESRGTEEGLKRTLEFDGAKLRGLLGEAEAYNASRGGGDGAKALRGFLEVFEPEAERSGCEAGWRAVRERVRRQ